MKDEAPKRKEKKGLPGWVMTFADLMSLLLCFFVLLLSFSQMDLLKFKQVAGSMEKAFGVQREVKAKETPKGTSIIAQKFSPGRPDPTVFNIVKQSTVDDHYQTLQFNHAKGGDSDASGQKGTEFVKEAKDKTGGEEDSYGVKSTNLKNEEAEAELQAHGIASTLAAEIESGKVEVETQGSSIVIRILEKGSFKSGSDIIEIGFEPVIKKLRLVLMSTPGAIQIAGHTDNNPIETDRFRSNWELSSARAVSVAQELLAKEGLNPRRIVVSGHGPTRPIALNDNPINREKNRRVEIVILKGDHRFLEGKAGAPEYKSDIHLEDKEQLIALTLPDFYDYSNFDIHAHQSLISRYQDVFKSYNTIAWRPSKLLLLKNYNFISAYEFTQDLSTEYELKTYFKNLYRSFKSWEPEKPLSINARLNP